ncbi:MAG: hypothetical protein AUI33_13690 [Ignavibacteria bacterium 13_1_40CM_2_61_4]|nr:MAG: hypothetical protein AUI33_13690 [Ignavibacteria bacterium 13_1_40CM_2_61_4]
MKETFCRGLHGLNGLIRGIRVIRGPLLILFLFNLSSFAKCPVSDQTVLVVRAPIGDLQVDTTGREAAVDVQVDRNAIQVQETCAKDSVEYTSTTPDPSQIRGTVVWKILAPKNIDLDLVTLGGSINVGDVDGDVILRTSGGSVTAGQIKGKAAIITQGGFIKSGNIGRDAELRSQGGTLEVGDVGGNAEFHTTAGQIRVGNVTGSVMAEGGRTIYITRAGEVKATTNAGDISIGDATRINAKSGGGNITSRRVRGPFQGHTESGDIRLDSAAAWVEASTGAGNIIVHLVPDNIDGDLHMDLQAGVGDVTVFMPRRLKATIDATVQRPAFQAQQIFSDFPMTGIAPSRPAQGLIENRFYAPTHSQSLLNGGGNKITLHTSLGKIVIRSN